MPCTGGYYYGNDARKEAERQVREKFPALARDTSGWLRAVENRMRRIQRG